jgi:hypothetical protein
VVSTQSTTRYLFVLFFFFFFFCVNVLNILNIPNVHVAEVMMFSVVQTRAECSCMTGNLLFNSTLVISLLLYNLHIVLFLPLFKVILLRLVLLH